MTDERDWLRPGTIHADLDAKDYVPVYEFVDESGKVIYKLIGWPKEELPMPDTPKEEPHPPTIELFNANGEVVVSLVVRSHQPDFSAQQAAEVFGQLLAGAIVELGGFVEARVINGEDTSS